MGIFYERIGVGNPAGGGLVFVSALVDTGASYSMLPASLLQRLGVEPRRRSSFALADGRRVEYDIGVAFINIGDQGQPCLTVFAPERTYILGADTLANFRLLVNPFRERLEPERQTGLPGL